ncbi:MAG: hypothetical protein LBK95_02075 [Bifidobacteriaceae bacterium]|nr:hypothetical protein [Bifidobacteriaceae bacterium]
MSARDERSGGAVRSGRRWRWLAGLSAVATLTVVGLVASAATGPRSGLERGEPDLKVSDTIGMTFDEAERMGLVWRDGAAVVGIPRVVGTSTAPFICVGVGSRSTIREDFRVSVVVDGREIGSRTSTLVAKGGAAYWIPLTEYPEGREAKVYASSDLSDDRRPNSRSIPRLPELPAESDSAFLDMLEPLACRVGVTIKR